MMYLSKLIINSSESLFIIEYSSGWNIKETIQRIQYALFYAIMYINLQYPVFLYYKAVQAK